MVINVTVSHVVLGNDYNIEAWEAVVSTRCARACFTLMLTLSLGITLTQHDPVTLSKNITAG